MTTDSTEVSCCVSRSFDTLGSLTAVITLIKGKVEEVELPVPKVDIIIR